ncbi:hypothetical protein D3C78_1318150 [compost metagenome]
MRFAGGQPEGVRAAGQQQFVQRQQALLAERIVEEAAPRHAVGAAAVQVAGQLDHRQVVVLVDQLGLQPGFPALRRAAQQRGAVVAQRGGERAVGRFPGHRQQGLLDQGVELRLVGKLQGVDVDQAAALARAVVGPLLPGDALRRQPFGLATE